LHNDPIWALTIIHLFKSWIFQMNRTEQIIFGILGLLFAACSCIAAWVFPWQPIRDQIFPAPTRANPSPLNTPLDIPLLTSTSTSEYLPTPTMTQTNATTLSFTPTWTPTFTPTITASPIDTDGDALTDTEEYTFGTNPFNRDSDDDTIDDGQEVTAGTNPSRKDPEYYIMAMDIASTDHVFTWYKNNTRSEGTSSDLSEYGLPGPYILPAG
jgi:hypothetical protein